ncbi:MAG: phosphotransferase family protein [Solirubrobacterales bacterium]|nr:phosphotransferase family protein [Solirubrobacterales bacterium]
MNEVEDGISEGPLEAWFRERVPEIEPPLDYEKIHGGLSNLTFLVTDQSGARWVLRRPPLGKRLGSAHDMGREVKVVEGLAATDVPVPPVVGYCEDETVTGAPFYVMEFVEGPVLRSPVQAALFPEAEQRRLIGTGLVDTLARIHAVDPDAVGLGDLGRREGYVERQLKRWNGQWEKSKTRELPLVERIHDRLVELAPPQTTTTLVHGDFRLDNVIYSPTGEVAAVVDWELCTLGDPLADLGLLMVYWVDPGQPGSPLLTPASTEPGFPTKRELAEHYAEVSGRDISNLDFFIALGYWKLTIILEGVLARITAGQYGSSGQPGPEFEQTIQGLAKAAAETIENS